MRKLIVTIAAGALLLVGATTVLAAPSAETIDPASAPTVGGRGVEVLEGVLDDLVADGTITQAQADKIVAAVEAEKDAIQAEREKNRELVKTFLEDGKITQEELDQLPEDHPLRQLESLMDDGVITQEELQSLRPFGGRGHGHGHWGDGDADTDDGTTPEGSTSDS
jgi:polyhydroxyalkanoate synthesis regulator phasin